MRARCGSRKQPSSFWSFGHVPRVTHSRLFAVHQAEVSFTEVAAVGAALSDPFEYCLEEDDKRLPTSIADLVGDTAGDILGMEVVLFGSFAEVMCAMKVFAASSDALENSWKAWRYPVLLFSLELRTLDSFSVL